MLKPKMDEWSPEAEERKREISSMIWVNYV